MRGPNRALYIQIIPISVRLQRDDIPTVLRDLPALTANSNGRRGERGPTRIQERPTGSSGFLNLASLDIGISFATTIRMSCSGKLSFCCFTPCAVDLIQLFSEALKWALPEHSLVRVDSPGGLPRRHSGGFPSSFLAYAAQSVRCNRAGCVREGDAPHRVGW